MLQKRYNTKTSKTVPYSPQFTVLQVLVDYLEFKRVLFIFCSLSFQLCVRFNAIGQQVLNQGFAKLDRYHSQCAKGAKGPATSKGVRAQDAPIGQAL